MKISLRVLVTALFLSSLVGALAELSSHIELFVLSLNEILFWLNALLVIGFIVNPILVFVTFFFICRKIEIVNNLLSVTFSLFVGVLIGFWIGFSPAIYFMTQYYGGLNQTTVLVQLTTYIFTGSFPLLFFTSLSAICVASIVKKNWNKTKNERN